VGIVVERRDTDANRDVDRHYLDLIPFEPCVTDSADAGVAVAAGNAGNGFPSRLVPRGHRRLSVPSRVVLGPPTRA
jgi:hypothetical protein